MSDNFYSKFGIIQLHGLAGFGEAFGIVAGALTFKAVLASSKVFGVVS